MGQGNDTIHFRARLIDFLLPLALLFGTSVIIRLTDLDLKVSGRFFSESGGWFLGGKPIWQAFYHYGTYPAAALGVWALAVLIFSFFRSGLKGQRRRALFILCALLIGPGLIVNVCFKDHWGRPRPREVVTFSGTESFVPVLEMGTGDGKSFPSGHASMGFFLIIPYFCFRKKQPKTSYLILGGGLGYGILMGIARIAQGGHFVSDIIWSAGFVYLTGLVLSWFIRPEGDHCG